MVGVVVNLLIALLFFLLAIVFLQGKGASLIAGYNTLPVSEKAQYDEAALCKFMGKIMFGICGCMLLLAVSEWLDSSALLTAGMVLIFILIGFAVFYSNSGSRFQK